MYLSTQNLKHHVAKTDAGRYALDTLALTKTGVVSADGHRLLYTPYPEIDPETVPNIAAVDGSQLPPNNGMPLLVNVGDAVEAAKLAKRHQNPACEVVHASYEATITGDAGDIGRKITFGATDLSREKTLAVTESDGRYPNYRSVLPAASSAETLVTFDVALLRHLLLQIEKSSTTEDVQTVTFRIADDKTGVLLSTNDGIGAIMMPLIGDDVPHNDDILSKLP